MQTPDHKQDEKSGWSRLKQVIDWSGMSVNRFAGAVGLPVSYTHLTLPTIWHV